MPAPEKNTNARKGKVNRQMWSHRLPVDVIEIIRTQAAAIGVSQADYVTAAVRQYNNAVQADATTTAPLNKGLR